MEIPLNSPSRKRLAIGAAAALCLIYIFLAAWLFVASGMGKYRPGKYPSSRACNGQPVLDPWNAEYRNNLGDYFTQAGDLDAAIAPYRAAVQLNPHSARYWLDLGNAYIVLGDIPNQAWTWNTRSTPIRPHLMSLGRPPTFTLYRAKTRKLCVNSASFWRMIPLRRVMQFDFAGASVLMWTDFCAMPFPQQLRPISRFSAY